MKHQEFKPALYIKKEGALSLSGTALIELLQVVLDKGIPFRFRAKGFSMSPFIKNNDVITISPLSHAYPRRGDIVALVHPKKGRLSVHRVVRKKDDLYLIKGDNAPEADGLISQKSIIGYVTCIERRGKKMFLGLGPERFLITYFTSSRLLFSLLKPVVRLLSLIKERGPQHG